MSKKKLVVSGDSWTAGIWPTSKDGVSRFLIDDTKPVDFKFPHWPDYLGDMLNMDVINVGFAGRGNEFIYNSIVDKLSITKDIGFAVACWSDHLRWDFNSSGNPILGDGRPFLRKTLSIDPSNPNPFENWHNRSVALELQPIIDMFLERKLTTTEHNFFKTLRWYNAFQNYCECNDISYLQCSAFNTLSDDIISLMLDHPIFYKMKEDHFCGWPMFVQIGGFNLSDKLNEVDPEMRNLRVSDEDPHPNTKGHKVIAELLYKQYELVYD